MCGTWYPANALGRDAICGSSYVSLVGKQACRGTAIVQATGTHEALSSWLACACSIHGETAELLLLATGRAPATPLHAKPLRRGTRHGRREGSKGQAGVVTDQTSCSPYTVFPFYRRT
ncbi:hypothetical protein MRX96_009752 [Rhipicephalus microplus]